MAGNGDGELAAVLKPFYDRATEAEERLAKLEAALGRNKGNSVMGQEELLISLSELQSKLEKARLEQISEKEKALKEREKLETENAKLKYQITHLLRSLKEADAKLAMAS